jgi:hypothetical protein
LVLNSVVHSIEHSIELELTKKSCFWNFILINIIHQIALYWKDPAGGKAAAGWLIDLKLLPICGDMTHFGAKVKFKINPRKQSGQTYNGQWWMV